MSEEISILTPECHGNRDIYPVIRRLSLSFGTGLIISIVPVALLIREKDSWFFVSLEEGFDVDLLMNMLPGKDREEK